MTAEQYNLLNNFSELAIRRLEDKHFPDLKVLPVYLDTFLIGSDHTTVPYALVLMVLQDRGGRLYSKEDSLKLSKPISGLVDDVTKVVCAG